MKHPALTRVFAIVLMVLCLVMLLAGVLGNRSAAEDRQKGLRDLALLQDRMEEYRTVTLALEGKISYAEASAALSERQNQHNEDASQHKTDLATYTATRSGLNEGMKALDEAEGLFYAGKEQYEEGLRQFEAQESAFWSGYNQFVEGKNQLASGKAQLQLMVDLIEAARWELENLKIIDEIILDEEMESPDARIASTLAAYDGAIYGLEAALSLTESLKDQGGISAEQMAMLKTVVEENSDLELGDIELPAITAEQIQEFEDAVASVIGMSGQELLDKVRSDRDSISLGDEETPATEEEFELIRAVYWENTDLINSAITAIEDRLLVFEGTLAETQGQLDAAQAEIDALEPLMAQGKDAIQMGRAALDEAGQQIAEGEQALVNGRYELWSNLSQLDEKEAALQQEKTELEQDAEELRKLQDEAQNQKELEQRQRSLRLLMLDRDEVNDRVDRGMELYSAAIAGSEQMEQDTNFAFQFRRLACVLMIAGAVWGLIGLPAAFEAVRSRFLLIAPVFMALLCAAGADALFYYMGRGHSYSALAVVIFAFLQLLIVIPEKKRKGKH